MTPKLKISHFSEYIFVDPSLNYKISGATYPVVPHL